MGVTREEGITKTGVAVFSVKSTYYHPTDTHHPHSGCCLLFGRKPQMTVVAKDRHLQPPEHLSAQALGCILFSRWYCNPLLRWARL